MADPIRSDADLIRASEGLRLAAYDDATCEPVPAGGQCKGTLTIGRGHTGPDVYAGQVCTTAEAEAWFQWDLARARRRAAAALGPDHWARLDEVRRAALTDMAFCLGGVGLSRFALMLQAVAAGDWGGAYHECLLSRWRQQAPARVMRDATMLLTGQWPE